MGRDARRDQLAARAGAIPPVGQAAALIGLRLWLSSELAEALEVPDSGTGGDGLTTVDPAGHVSTFIGDGILAYFGAIQPNPWQSDDAVRAALAMRDAMREYNAELEKEGLPPLAVGIGIHRGPGLAGLIGSRERMEYGFVGRTVNLAARVQALTRVHQVDVLVTEAVRAELDASFVLAPMPAEVVKGIAEPVLTYAVRDARVASPAIG